MSNYMGFHESFVLIVSLLGIFTGYAVFTLKRLDIAITLFLVWFCLVLFEFWLQNREFENWKRRVFQ
jgi:hypothetical protein